MLHYEGLITKPMVEVNKMDSGPNLEILKFYDDKLPEESCGLVQEILQEYFNSDTRILVYYDKDQNRAIIEMTIFFDEKSETSQLVNESKTALEKYYAQNKNIR